MVSVTNTFGKTCFKSTISILMKLLLVPVIHVWLVSRCRLTTIFIFCTTLMKCNTLRLTQIQSRWFSFFINLWFCPILSRNETFVFKQCAFNSSQNTLYVKDHVQLSRDRSCRRSCTTIWTPTLGRRYCELAGSWSRVE